MRDAAFWKDRWLEVPTHVDLIDVNEKREKTGFVSVVTWPLILLILQAGIFAPLYGSGFLNSPFEGDGVLIGPPTDPEVADPALPLDPPVDGPTTAPTPSTPASPTATATVPPAAQPTTAPNEPTSSPRPRQPRRTTGTDGTPGSNGTPGTPGQVVVPGPNVAPIPEVVSLNLTKNQPSRFVLNTKGMYPGQTRVVALQATNTGNVPLGQMRMSASTNSALLKNAQSGLQVTTWTCSVPWGGNVSKPTCNGALGRGGSFSLASGGGGVGAAAGNPGNATYILAAIKLPSAADNRYQGISGDVSFRVSAQQTGGVVQ